MTQESVFSGAAMEARANERMVRALIVMLCLFSGMWLLNMAHVFIVEDTLMNIAMVVVTTVLAVPAIVCRYVDMERPWVKFLLIGSCGLSIVAAGTILSFHLVLAFAIPILFAAQYRSKAMVYITFLFMVAGLYFSVMVGYFYGVADLNMMFLSANSYGYYLQDALSGTMEALVLNANPWVTLPLYFVLPRAALMFVFAYILVFVVSDRVTDAIQMYDLQRESETDKATHFFSRPKYDQMLRDYYPNVDEVGVIFWDVNNLKTVNDTFGHSQGDWLIGLLAASIATQASNTRRVYRIGGDEFVMLLENPKPGEMQRVVEAVDKVIARNNAQSKLKLAAAHGFTQGPGSEIQTLVQRADLFMYHDKDVAQGKERLGYSEDVIHDDLFEAMSSLSAQVHMFICDLSAGKCRMSRHMVAYFGLPGEYMDFPSSWWEERMHPEDRQRFLDSMDEVLSGRKSLHEGECRILNADDEYVRAEFRGRIIGDRQRFAQYFVGCCTVLPAE